MIEAFALLCFSRTRFCFSPTFSSTVTAPSLSNSIWATKSLLGTSVDIGGDSEIKDVPIFERDTNANGKSV